MRAQVAQGVENFLVGFAQPDHQPGLGRHMGKPRLEILQQFQRMRVVRTRARLFVQPRHGFEIVVHHVGRARRQDVEGDVEATAEVRHQDFDARLRRQFTHCLDAVLEMPGAAVAQVIAVDAGDDHVFEFQRGNGFGEMARFIGIRRFRPAVTDIAERAAPRAQVAEDHECRRAFAETFADVRAGRFFANGMQLLRAQDVLDFLEARAVAEAHANPVGFFQRR